MFHLQHIPTALILALYYRASKNPGDFFLAMSLFFVCGLLGQSKNKLFRLLTCFKYLNIRSVKTMSESIPPGSEASELFDSCVDSELASWYMSEKI